MSTAIVRATDINMDDLQRMAKMMVASGYFDAARDATQAVAQMAIKIMAGREMGYGPFASVQGIHVIQGKPSLAANLMAAAVKAHPRYDYRVRKMSNEAVVIEFFEDGQSLGVSEFTADDAKKANTQNMGKFPRNMLFARALSNGVRWYCPDVFSGNTVYVPEELGATVDGDGNVIDTPMRRVDVATGEIIEQPQHRQPQAPNDSVRVIEAQLRGVEGKEIERAGATDVDFGMGEPPPADDPFTAETPEQPKPAKNGKAGVITEAQRNTLHALGMALYGDKATWDMKRPGMVKAITKNRAGSSNELWQGEAVTLIAKLEAKIREAYSALANNLAAGAATLDPNVLVEIDGLSGVELANSYKALKAMQPVAAGK